VGDGGFRNMSGSGPLHAAAKATADTSVRAGQLRLKKCLIACILPFLFSQPAKCRRSIYAAAA
jgi:hypothetical protein